ncbi:MULTISPECIES: hypothetical protein [unclassified Streptomyces]|uniref:hypothetical protein n=1 Tax=unclassified Streptomyces TaxID=2593676 RepID=UPI0009A0F28E|nr:MULTISPECIES: hypothetical protein [unclassified Streptomyces]
MIRNVIGAVLAVVGAAAAVWSPFRVWYDGRQGRYYEIDDLFTGVTSVRADLWWSLFLPFVFGAVLTLVGLLLWSRLVVAAAGVVVLGFTVLWMVRQGQAAGSLSAGSDDGLGWGVALSVGGGVLLLLAAAVMVGRPRRRRVAPVGTTDGYDHGEPRHGEDPGYGRPYDPGHGPRHARPRGTRHDAIPGPDRPEYPGYPESPGPSAPPDSPDRDRPPGY